VGVLADKDWKTMLPPLLARVDAAVLTVPPSAPPDRKWDARVAAEALRSAPRASGRQAPAVRAVADFGEAFAAVAEQAGKGTVVVTGSVHTVGNAMRLLGVDPLG
jgi:dihydrofolate synthase/folylpolyglutamate synthase